jgi:hypothetical protein
MCIEETNFVVVANFSLRVAQHPGTNAKAFDYKYISIILSHTIFIYNV